jgi:hypothetical protein
MKHATTIALAICGLGWRAAAMTEEGVVDLGKLSGRGVRILTGYAGRPDAHGVMEQYELRVPTIEAGVYYRGGWWPAGANRVYGEIVDGESLGRVAEGGLFLLLKIAKDDYLALLPIACRIAYTWLHSKDGRLVLKMGTHGKDAIRGDIPLYSWGRAANPYEACYAAWAEALSCGPVKGAAFLRKDKKYPEAFRYLGYCTWEHFKGRIDEAKMLGAMRAIERSGLPIRFFLVDDGHFDRSSLAPGKKFPNGYKPLTAMRKADGIRWVGIWYAFLGNNHGVSAPGNLGEVNRHMLKCRAGKLLPRHNEEAARAFYEHMLAFARRDGVDFLKVDFQTDALPFYAGVKEGNPLRGLPADSTHAIGNPLAAAANLAGVFRPVVDARLDGLINCNWHNAVSLFHSGPSVVGRCSEDYKVGNLSRARAHLYHSYAAIPWLGQIAWGDHDMFHSNDRFAGRMMAVSKAMSGGPVYLSDAPAKFAPNAIRPLCYADGLLLRPLAPAAPLPDSLFADQKDESLYRAMAPLANRAAAIVVYNLVGGVGKSEDELKAVVTPRDYAQAGGMVQPYPGRWPVPSEGLFVYDWYAGKGRKLGEGFLVAIRGFGDRLLQISPTRNGWSVVGRTDKYLSAAAVEIVSCTAGQLKVRLHEAGPLAVYSAKGAPKADGLTFTSVVGGLYKAAMPVGERGKAITITR